MFEAWRLPFIGTNGSGTGLALCWENERNKMRAGRIWDDNVNIHLEKAMLVEPDSIEREREINGTSR